MPPPNLLPWSFELKELEKQQMQGEAFYAPPYLPGDRSSKRSSIVNKGMLTSLTRQKTRSDDHSWTDFITNLSLHFF